nr:nucleotidyltransferase family protein [Gammaproteobacteria bacterium]
MRTDHSPVTSRVAALVLAAGRSRRMGSRNKLLIEIAGQTIISHTVDAVIGSQATHPLVVTGYQRSELQRALRTKRVRLVHNADYRHGLSRSLRCGLAALGTTFDGVLIALGDMPLVTSAAIDRLIAAFRQLPHPAVCIPTCGGRRGNPVVFPRALLAELAELRGDVGAQPWIAQNGPRVHAVEMKTDAVLIDIDSPISLYRLRYRLSPGRLENRPAPWTGHSH